MVNKNITVAVGMSGGVDSSVAAALLKEQGYNVIGITMKIWDGSFELEDTGKDACFGPGESEDIKYAEEVCEKLNIPYHVFDLSDEYKQHVLEYFKDEYKNGRTPNPCVMCNHKMKFGFLTEKARDQGINFDYFATGHYARIKNVDGKNYLAKSLNLKKDQTYFLSGLEKDQLNNIKFPLGEYDKDKVRAVAADLGFKVAMRPDSQDFISGGDYTPLFNEVEAKSGEIIDDNGNTLGKHKGIMFYTIGQRKGLGISSDRPLYVTKIDAKNNKIIVSDNHKLFSTEMQVKAVNLMKDYNVGDKFVASVKIRQNHTPSSANIEILADKKVKVEFVNAQRAVTPGQIAVFYNEDIVIGGGKIV